MTTTVRMKASDIYKDWHVLDAAGRPLGRIATEAAVLLRGKHKPTYEPHLDDGDFVIVINASKVKVTGRKESQMRYYRHSGYPGGLKSRSFPEQMSRFPDRVLERAIKGMLPKGSLGEAIAKHLKVYPGPNHPHSSQVTGTANVVAARVAAAAAAEPSQMKAPRLRPLSIPQGSEAAVEEAVIDVVEAPVAEIVAEESKPTRRRRKAEEPVAAEASEAPEASSESEPVVEAAAEPEAAPADGETEE